MMYISGLGTPYWYEWEIGLLECLKMMTNNEIKSVVLQSEDFQSLDDVVVNYNDGSIINIQVKHTDTNESFTYSTLNSGEPSMLKKWATEWQKQKSNYRIREIRVVTNRPWGTHRSDDKCSFKTFVDNVIPKLQNNFSYNSKKKEEAAACEWIKKQLDFLGNDVQDFLKILNFRKNGDLSEVDSQIKENISHILGTERKNIVEASLNNLFAKLSEWATSKRKRQEIYREDIYRALCTSSKDLPKYDLSPEKPIFSSRIEFANYLISRLQESDKKVFFLQGFPGSGKTNFVSYLAQLDNSIVDLKFYTYLPVNKEYPSYSDDTGYYTGDYLWRSILTQLKEYFEGKNLLYTLHFPLIYDFLSVEEMRTTALKFLNEYAKTKGKTCFIFIDGLDHAARSKDARNSYLPQLPLPDEIDGDIKFVLVGQPINDKYPHQFVDNKKIEYIDMPLLKEFDIIELISKEGIKLSDIDNLSLAKSVIAVVGNNALNVLFAIREVRKLQSPYSFDSIIKCLKERKLNGQIDRYYDWIVSSITDDGCLLSKIKIIFAFASQKISADQIADMCEERLDNIQFILNKLYPLIVCDSDGYYAFHNDVRLYLKESMTTNSNYEVLATSINKRINKFECLHRYKYDISFNMTIELKDKQAVFELFSPEYIIKSVEYNISVNKLIQQLQSLSQLIIDSGTLNNIDIISNAALTISQFINNIQYNQKENLFDESKPRYSKTESEKYILSIKDRMNDIISDIYSLLKDGLYDRAKSVFDEYLKSTTLNDFLNNSKDNPGFEFYTRCGYICRFFSKEILHQDISIDNSLYKKFVEGWLDASSEYINDVDDIKTTLSFKYYNKKNLNTFTKRITSNKLTSDIFGCLCEIYLSGNGPISSLIDLCVYGILNKQSVTNLKQEIMMRQKELLSSHEFECNWDRISYYIKAYFCLYPDIKNAKGIPELYINILKKNHITLKDRGYNPAIEQIELTKRISEFFYKNKNDYDEQLDILYRIVFFENKFGSGSCLDCNAYDVRTFLLNVLFNMYAYKNDDNGILSSQLCKDIKLIFLCDKAIYLRELSELFYLANAEDMFLEITEYWCGPNGILWDKSYDNVEFVGKDIVRILKQFKRFTDAELIEKRIMYKLFGYVDHKDYSLHGLLECYELLPLSEEKLLDQGMKLLSISDKASSIGDNRLSGEIDNVMFRTAIDLGIKYASALFELKNTPNSFYLWRSTFLDILFEYISNNDLPDSELIALYLIVNAWINKDIESSKRRDYNKLDYLNRYNNKIINKIRSQELKTQLSSRGECSPKDDTNIDETLTKSSRINNSIIDEIKEKGYSPEIEQRILASFSDLYNNQTNLILKIGNIIDAVHRPSFVSNCVVEYINARRKYGYTGTGLKEIIKEYCYHFSDKDWIRLFKAVVISISPANTEMFYGINDDIETLCLYYYKQNMPDKLSELCTNKLNTHLCWLTSCGLTNITTYELIIDDTIGSLEDFAKKQIKTKFTNI